MTHAQPFLLVTRHSSLATVLVLLASLLPHSASAQVTTGTPPFGSFGGGPDIINLGSLNARLSIPVRHKPGRGVDFTYDLTYDSTVWHPVSVSGTLTWQPVSATWGWNGTTPTGSAYTSYSGTYSSGACGQHGELTYYQWYYTNFMYADDFGMSHGFGDNYTIYFQSPGGPYCPPGGPQPPTPAPWAAWDGSGYTLYASPSTWSVSTSVFAANGASTNGQGAFFITDRNGNQITSGNGVYTDTLGTTGLTVAGQAPNNTTFSYTAPSGASASYTMKYTTYSIQTNFGCTGIVDYGTNGTTTASLVSEIDLPDITVNPNDKYTFTYEPTPGHSGFVTGRLKSGTLPTGGNITYTYTGGSSGNITCADGSTAGLSRILSDGANWSATWTYVRTAGTGAAYTTTITDPERDTLAPNGNDTVIQFQGIYETQRQTYQGLHTTGTLLETLNTCYNGSASPCTGTAITLPISSRKMTTILAGGLQSEHDDTWTSFGVSTETDDYDYGAAPHGPLLKKVIATIAPLGNIHAFRQTVVTCNGTGTSTACTGPSGSNTGTVVAQTNYNYDEGTLATTSGIPQHVSVTGSRGNLTSVNIYKNSSTFLTHSSTYYDTGTVSTTNDVNTAQTTYNYTAGTASCYNTFPTSVTEPISGLSTSATWNCTGGVQLTAVDENGQTTSTAYTDPYFWRPASITDPTNAVTNFCYGIVNAGSCTLNPIQSESYLTFNSNNSTVDTLTTLDGLGRVRIQQTRQGPTSTSFDSVETDYDALGRPSRATLPYSAAAGGLNSTIAATTTTYDPYNRPLTVQDGGGGITTYNYGNANDTLVTRSPAPQNELTKVRQFEYDALQRLTSVCEVTAGTPTWPGGSCAQTTSKTGYWTKYANDPMGDLMTLTQNAQNTSNQQTRSYVYDWMGRMTSETVPEIGATGNGTASYTYDSDAKCGTSNGDVVNRVDAAGDVICSTYDALHRELTRTYPSGPYASVTPAKHFVYDGATVNGVTMQKPKARLAEAYTCTGACSTKLTDVGFSYSLRGETADVYESTPNSGLYYHVGQSYWANGTTNQLTGNIGLPTTITYSPDGEGRINSVSATSGQNPVVSGTVYNAAGLPTTMNLGSGTGDADTYRWDSNTNRMTQYNFTVNAVSLTANLGWNANGTLQTQNITDGFNSADTQNCSYQYDDITRVTSANCVTAASQTFSYDPFGNINKAGSPYAFNAFYSSSTNRITCIGGSGQSCTGGVIPTYDSNGNVTNDSFHNYAWDADGHAITVDAGLSDAVSLTYDALGRMVEQKRGSVYTQIAYSPIGQKLALMSGSTLQKAMVPLTGQAQAVYNSSGLFYYAHPDLLGSIRLATTPGRAMYFDTAYAPFGETYASAGGANLDPAYTGQMADTAHRQDTAGGLYDFPVREYSIQGRWPSPDPAGVSATCRKNPQTQNRYAYVTNNPLSYVDPLGTQGGPCWLEPCGGGGGCAPDDPSCCAPGDPSCCQPGDPSCCDPCNDPFCPLPLPPGGCGEGIGAGEPAQKQKPKSGCETHRVIPGVNLPKFADWCADEGMTLVWAVDCTGDINCCIGQQKEPQKACESLNKPVWDPTGTVRLKLFVWRSDHTNGQNVTGYCCRKKG